MTALEEIAAWLKEEHTGHGWHGRVWRWACPECRMEALRRAAAQAPDGAWKCATRRGLAPGEMECDACDGCGWVEGGEALQTTCKTCGGTGRAPAPAPRCPDCGQTLDTEWHGVKRCHGTGRRR
jgi:hypothetical protein